MNIEETVFKKYIPDFNKLLSYGFKRSKAVYFYEKIFNNNEFKAIIQITDKGKISGKVHDLENDDEFLPYRVETQNGAFVCGIRDEYQKFLTDIRDNCFIENYFIFPQSNRITNLVIEKYGDKPDFMWENLSDYGVFKNAINNKWYGIIMNIAYSKLGINNSKLVEVLNVKLDKDKIQKLLKRAGFYPAWHMNKKSWISITLDETLNDNEIMSLISESYSYTIKTHKH